MGNDSLITAPISACSRHRMTVDGEGITTLVCFHGCPLRCKYCLNPFTLSPDGKRTVMTPQELYDRVKIDNLYFLATGGGVTFGGGEPLLYPDFLREFRSICNNPWRLTVESALNVPWENVQAVADCIDEFIIDCKDTNPEIYHRYTGQRNEQMLENLQKLVKLVGAERILLRLPLIPDFNTEQDRRHSQALLQSMGITRFDPFTYLTPDQRPKRSFTQQKTI